MAVRPNAPTTPRITSINANAMFVTFEDGPDNGSSIDSRIIAYSQTSTTPANNTSYPTVLSDGSTSITGLIPGRKYYFWARTHNAIGYSNWSGRGYATTLNVPDAPTTPLLSSITSTTVDISWSANGTGGSPITGYQVGYGLAPAGPSTIVNVSGSSPKVITGLQPGYFYYFWVRAKNAIGYSPWSSYISHRTVSGAYVKVDGVWRFAVPYVKVSGVWKVAEPWVRYVGEWKRTTN